MVHDFALLMTTCDAYYDVGKHFFPILQLFWRDFDEKAYILTESRTDSYGYEKAVIINVPGEPNWSSRLEKALEKINEKYVLFTMDDYFFGKVVDSSIFEELLAQMERYGIKYLDLRNNGKAKERYDIPYLGLIPDDKKYGISLQAAIWEKEFLLSKVKGCNCSAWGIENKMNSDVKERFSGNRASCAVDLRNTLNIQNGVIKGKWRKQVINFYKKRGYIIDPGDRPFLSFRERTKVFLIANVGYRLPKRLGRFIKKIAKKMGVSFATD